MAWPWAGVLAGKSEPRTLREVGEKFRCAGGQGENLRMLYEGRKNLSLARWGGKETYVT